MGLLYPYTESYYKMPTNGDKPKINLELQSNYKEAILLYCEALQPEANLNLFWNYKVTANTYKQGTLDYCKKSLQTGLLVYTQYGL